MAKISIVGVGPGSPEYVTPIARKTVQTAHVVIGAERSLNLFKDDINGEVIQLTAKNVNEALNNAVGSAEAGKTVVLLSTGDPCFSGLLILRVNRSYKGQSYGTTPISIVSLSTLRRGPGPGASGCSTTVNRKDTVATGLSGSFDSTLTKKPVRAEVLVGANGDGETNYVSRLHAGIPCDSFGRIASLQSLYLDRP